MAFRGGANNTNAGGTGTFTLTVSLAVLARSTIAVQVGAQNAGGVTGDLTSVTDNAAGGSNTYVLPTGGFATQLPGIRTEDWILYCQATKATETLTITANFSVGAATPNFAYITVAEYTGLGPFRIAGAMNEQSSPATTANAVTSGTAAVLSGDTLIGMTLDYSSNGTITAGTGFTQDLTSANFYMVESLVRGSSATVGATFTAGAANDIWATAMLAFRAVPRGYDAESQQRSDARFALLAQHHWKEPDEFLRAIGAVTPAQWGRYYQQEQFPKREWVRQPPARDTEFLLQVVAVTPPPMGFDQAPQQVPRLMFTRSERDEPSYAQPMAVFSLDVAQQAPRSLAPRRPQDEPSYAQPRAVFSLDVAQQAPRSPPPRRPQDESAYPQVVAAVTGVVTSDEEQFPPRLMIARRAQDEPAYPQVAAVVTAVVLGDEEQFPARLMIVRRAQDEPAYVTLRVIVIGDPEQFAHRFFRQIGQQQELVVVLRAPIVIGDVEQFPRRVYRDRAQLDPTVDIRGVAPAALGPIGFDPAAQFPVRFEFIKKRQDEPGYQIAQITPPPVTTNPWVGFIGNTGRMMIRRG